MDTAVDATPSKISLTDRFIYAGLRWAGLGAGGFGLAEIIVNPQSPQFLLPVLSGSAIMGVFAIITADKDVVLERKEASKEAAKLESKVNFQHHAPGSFDCDGGI